MEFDKQLSDVRRDSMGRERIRRIQHVDVCQVSISILMCVNMCGGGVQHLWEAGDQTRREDALHVMTSDRICLTCQQTAQ